MKKFILVFFLSFVFSRTYSQCANANAYGTATAPATVGTVTISTCNFQSEYSTVSGFVAGNVYSATYSLGGCITVHSGSANGPVVAFGTTPLTFTATVTGTYYISYNTNCNSCNTQSNCGTSTIALVSTSGGGGGTGCTNTSSFGSAVAPTNNTPVTISTCNFQSEYSTVTNIVSGNTYQFTSSCGGYITVHSGTFNGPIVAAGNAPLSWTATSSGTFYIHYNTNSACGTATNCCTTTIACTSCGTSSTGCTNLTSFGSAVAPTTNTPVTISTCNYQNEYSTITNIIAGSTYVFNSSCGGYITIHSGTYNGPIVAAGNAPLTWTATSSGTFFIHYNTNAACGTATNCCTTTITCTSCSSGSGCTGGTANASCN
ncbi:MAG: hypothetical protein ACK5AY_05045, partial [Bacteroidota bacterium]